MTVVDDGHAVAVRTASVSEPGPCYLKPECECLSYGTVERYQGSASVAGAPASRMR
jgi:hypothetical protein